jgi:hypothetical protein
MGRLMLCSRELPYQPDYSLGRRRRIPAAHRDPGNAAKSARKDSTAEAVDMVAPYAQVLPDAEAGRRVVRS